MGDPAGIGPELAVKAWLALRSVEACQFAIVADPVVVQRAASDLGGAIQLATVSSLDQVAATFEHALPVLPLNSPCKAVVPGHPDVANAGAILEAITTGVRLCQAGEASGLVTLPIAKAPLAAAGFGFPGHTEFLGSLAPPADGDSAAPVMMLCGPDLRVALATVHVPLAKVPGQLETGAIVKTLACVRESLIKDFGIASPRIAVCGLNPHAGEDGVLGLEEKTVIAPAVAAARRLGIDAGGPHAADSLFHAEARQTYDAVLAMYHDQGLVPLKMLAFWDGVNVTIGLPIVRTSPDHGTAFDIAGKGIARVDSTIAAIKMASEIAQRRARP